jgi:succinyl-diaminopimelate desuccinylase
MIEKKIINAIEEFREEITDDIIELSSIHPLSPDVGGDGEWEKGEWIKEKLKELGADDIIELNAPDLEVSSGYRPNIIGTFKGKSKKRKVWLLTHLDVEPVGDLSLWDGDPFDPYISEGKVFGRGTEDNNQDITAAFYAIKALKELDIDFPYDINLVFLSDEESGSKKGMRYILNNYPNLFSTEDYYIVPDGGTQDGLKIEIAEKGVIWFKFHIKGKATHASTPHLGKNTLKVCAKLVLALRELETKFPFRDSIFDPPYSTFEPTLKEKNIPNVNMIPGNDVFYMDVRVLPEYSNKEIEEEVKRISKKVEKEEGVKIFVSKILEIRTERKTPENSKIVENMKEAIKTVLKKEPKVTGIGVATLASFLRNIGLKVAVWRKINKTAHKPNEYCVINNAITDAQVFALTFIKE